MQTRIPASISTIDWAFAAMLSSTRSKGEPDLGVAIRVLNTSVKALRTDTKAVEKSWYDVRRAFVRDRLRALQKRVDPPGWVRDADVPECDFCFPSWATRAIDPDVVAAALQAVHGNDYAKIYRKATVENCARELLFDTLWHVYLWLPPRIVTSRDSIERVRRLRRNDEHGFSIHKLYHHLRRTQPDMDPDFSGQVFTVANLKQAIRTYAGSLLFPGVSGWLRANKWTKTPRA
jgi:hypothetical protein